MGTTVSLCGYEAIAEHLSAPSWERIMLRYPICGFAKRVDDTVARAMAILQNKPDFTAKPEHREPVEKR